MPDKKTIARARRDKRQGKSASTQAGEFVREEFHHIREGKHGARSTKQAIAIGLSKARRAGVKMRPPRRGTTSEETRERAERDLEQGRSHTQHRPSPRRSRAVSRALKREGHSAASTPAISRQAHRAAQRRSRSERHRSAMKAVHSRTRAERSRSARKAARTRASKAAHR